MPERIGFIGVGMMGHGMARNLVEKGFPLTVVAHRNRAPVDDLVKRGAAEVPNAKALAEASDAVFLCVNGAPQVEAAILGERGVLAGCRAGMVVVDCSTSQPAVTMRLATTLEKHGVAMADAPVTRAPVDAEAGRLNSLVGAAPEVFDRIRPMIEAYSETVLHFGPLGAGITAKLVNNFITLGYTALIAEGMAVCGAAGVDMRKMYEVMSLGAADSGVLRKMIPPFLDGDLSGHKFAIVNALKDVTYATEMMQAFEFDSFFADSLKRSYSEAVDRGFGDRLMASMMEMHEQRAGWPVVPRAKK